MTISSWSKKAKALTFLGMLFLVCGITVGCGSSDNENVTLNGYTFEADSATLTNRYLSASSGDVFTFTGNGAFLGSTYTWTFTDGEVIQGVKTVHEKGLVINANGESSVVFDSMLAQDTQGNVQVLKNTNGDTSELSGVAANAAPTFLMPANPTAGESFGPSIYYTGTVIALDETVDSHTNVLHSRFITEEANNKQNQYDDFWAPEIGPVKSAWLLADGSSGNWLRVLN